MPFTYRTLHKVTRENYPNESPAEWGNGATVDRLLVLYFQQLDRTSRPQEAAALIQWLSVQQLRQGALYNSSGGSFKNAIADYSLTSALNEITEESAFSRSGELTRELRRTQVAADFNVARRASFSIWTDGLIAAANTVAELPPVVPALVAYSIDGADWEQVTGTVTVDAGVEVRFQAVASIYNTVQWEGPGGNISGATSPILTLDAVTPTNDGNYFAKFTNPQGTTNSPVVTLAVTPAP